LIGKNYSTLRHKFCQQLFHTYISLSHYIQNSTY
jgi:hypothetical protein